MFVRTILINTLIFSTSAFAYADSDRASVVWEDDNKKINFNAGHGTCEHIAGGNLSQRIVDVAVNEWARFQFPVWDISLGGARVLPSSAKYKIAEPSTNPRLPSDGVVPRLIRQGSKEDDADIADRIAEYWAIVPGRTGPTNTQNSLWSHYPSAGYAIPWSAVFVSWVMCEAGLEFDNFKRRQAHRDYIYDIIKNGDDPSLPRAFKASNIEDTNDLAPGDIICADRQTKGQPYITNISDPRLKKGRATHCDIVVKVDDGKAYAIGGNVIDGVTMTMTPLNDNGTLKKSVKRHSAYKSDIRHWFAVLRLKDNKSRNEKPGTALEKALKNSTPKSELGELSGVDQ